jgi:hypothetical protein
MKKENLDKLVEETMNSLDGAAKASPAPFLLTRIGAKMANRQEQPSLWERAGFLITRPAIAFTVLATVLLMNVYIIASSANGNDSGMAVQNTAGLPEEYSLNTGSSLYDFENIQP